MKRMKIHQREHTYRHWNRSAYYEKFKNADGSLAVILQEKRFEIDTVTAEEPLYSYNDKKRI
jgi:hypothetical protein